MLYRTCVAKFVAEATPTVGKSIDAYILYPNGREKFIPQAAIEQMRQQWQASLKAPIDMIKYLDEAIPGFVQWEPVPVNEGPETSDARSSLRGCDRRDPSSRPEKDPLPKLNPIQSEGRDFAFSLRLIVVEESQDLCLRIEESFAFGT